MVVVKVPEYEIIEDKVVLESDKTALVIIDMQNDFVDPKGKLCV
ncbi:MAG: cysteine hydrolase, partial [Thermoprotei archaeon]